MTEPYTARHLGWDYTTAQARREHVAESTLRSFGGVTVERCGRHAAYDRYRITDPSTRLDMQMADEDVIA